MVFVATLLTLAFIQPKDAPPPPQPGAAPPATPAPAPPRVEPNPEVVLYMKDGSVFTGLLTRESPTQYVLEIAGVNATFAAEKVDRVKRLPPVIDRYKELRAATAETDIDQRITLIRWLADRKQVELALAEAELLQARNPKHVPARKLAEDLRTRVDLLIRPAKSQPPEDEPDGTAAPASDDGRITPREFPFLTDEQVALIKVYEVDLSARPRVIFPRDSAARMLEEFAGSPLVPASREGKEAILRQEPIDTVQLMFRLRARDYYDKVRIVDQPEPMRRFRDDVQRVTLLSGCATSQCHGGRDAGRLVLSSYRPSNDLTLYTNYYILTAFRTSDGRPLIDWEQPEQSLILQYALPREFARSRHPMVVKDGKDVWRPALTGPDDVRARGITDWIRSAYRPRPDYTLDYTPFRPFTPPAAAGGAPTGRNDPVVR